MATPTKTVQVPLHIYTWGGRTEVVKAFAFFPDGNRVVTAGHDDTSTRVWDLGNGQEDGGRLLGGHSAPTLSVAISKRSEITGGLDGKVLLWNTETRAVSRILHPGLPGIQILCVAFGPTTSPQLVASSGSDGVIRVWKLGPDEYSEPIKRLVIPNKPTVFSIAFAPGSPGVNHIAVASIDKKVRIYDVHSGIGELPLATFGAHTAYAPSLAWFPTGQQLACAGDKAVRIWDTRIREQEMSPRMLGGHSRLVKTVAVSPDGRFIASGSNDGTLRLWNAVTGVQIGSPIVHPASAGVDVVAFSPDGSVLLSIAKNAGYLWDMAYLEVEEGLQFVKRVTDDLVVSSAEQQREMRETFENELDEIRRTHEQELAGLRRELGRIKTQEEERFRAFQIAHNEIMKTQEEKFHALEKVLHDAKHAQEIQVGKEREAWEAEFKTVRSGLRGAVQGYEKGFKGLEEAQKTQEKELKELQGAHKRGEDTQEKQFQELKKGLQDLFALMPLALHFMTDTRSRKKSRKDPQKTQAVEREGNSASKPSSSSFSTTFVWLVGLIAVATYCYLNPKFVQDLLDDWIGFSEHYDGAPVIQQSYGERLPSDVARRDAVVAAFKHSWHAYEQNAMGADEYHPISQQGSNLTETGGIGYMIVDVIDTLQLMGLQEEYSRARRWVDEKLSFDRDDRFSTFETTIRVLGGLLSAYHLSGQDPLYLEKAIDLADRMLPAFDTPSGLPHPIINLAQRSGQEQEEFPGLVSVAEVATLQLEFRYLSHLTGKDEYWRAAEKVMEVVKRARLPHGLASVFMSVDEGHYITSVIRLGSRGDSFYEYLLKQYLQTNKSEFVYRDMYEDAMDAIHQYLIQESMGTKMTYTSELVPENGENEEISWRLTPKQDHLVCFLGGSLMLGATRTGALTSPVSIPPRPEELSDRGKRDWKTGVELIRTCMHTHDTATGLSPETIYFRVPSDGMDVLPNAPPDWYIKGAAVGEFPPYDARYMLRPETVESLFIAYRLTGDDVYRDHGWRIFQAIEKHCHVESGGYATVVNVDENPARLEDKMETFFLSETLKYLYLLFDGSDTIPLNQYVFNTEVRGLHVVFQRAEAYEGAGPSSAHLPVNHPDRIYVVRPLMSEANVTFIYTKSPKGSLMSGRMHHNSI
ncbi:unnamed protein product [Cyclocybe aegerita]|uniref:alpha-1,2-Mannosidase n=1 Tax=Cyclocybe aegerita TaxID=1973307 RepID=A0A8S0W6N3_CYCAE|nr:unnamed protein product [Cyclocybe aegerita]